MADSSGVFVRRSSEESRHYSWHFPSTFAVTIITALEIKCAVEGPGRHGRDGADLPVKSEASFVFARPVLSNRTHVSDLPAPPISVPHHRPAPRRHAYRAVASTGGLFVRPYGGEDVWIWYATKRANQ